MSNKVCIIDYGMGNLLSMQRALEKNGATVTLATTPDEIVKAEKLVLPGVGAFPNGMMELEKRSMIPAIHEYVKSGNLFLGVCLGMQMLFEESEEIIPTPGLGLIKGKVLKLPQLQVDRTMNKIPHVAWTQVEPAKHPWASSFFKTTAPGTYMYFVHSYYVDPVDTSDILAQSPFGDFNFCSAVIHNNVWGTQFHPEKSGEAGLNLLREFLL